MNMFKDPSLGQEGLPEEGMTKPDVGEKVEQTYDFQVVTDPEQRRLLGGAVMRLVEQTRPTETGKQDESGKKVLDYPYETLVFLDSSARPVQTLYRDFWHKQNTAEPDAAVRMPQVNFLNVGSATTDTFQNYLVDRAQQRVSAKLTKQQVADTVEQSAHITDKTFQKYVDDLENEADFWNKEVSKLSLDQIATALGMGDIVQSTADLTAELQERGLPNTIVNLRPEQIALAWGMRELARVQKEYTYLAKGGRVLVVDDYSASGKSLALTAILIEKLFPASTVDTTALASSGDKLFQEKSGKSTPPWRQGEGRRYNISHIAKPTHPGKLTAEAGDPHVQSREKIQMEQAEEKAGLTQSISELLPELAGDQTRQGLEVLAQHYTQPSDWLNRTELRVVYKIAHNDPTIVSGIYAYKKGRFASLVKDLETFNDLIGRLTAQELTETVLTPHSKITALAAQIDGTTPRYLWDQTSHETSPAGINGWQKNKDWIGANIKQLRSLGTLSIFGPDELDQLMSDVPPVGETHPLDELQRKLRKLPIKQLISLITDGVEEYQRLQTQLDILNTPNAVPDINPEMHAVADEYWTVHLANAPRNEA